MNRRGIENISSSRRGWLGSVLSALSLPLFPFLKNHTPECEWCMPESVFPEITLDTLPTEPMYRMEAKVENIQGKAYITRIETWRGEELLYVEDNIKEPLFIKIDEI